MTSTPSMVKSQMGEQKFDKPSIPSKSNLDRDIAYLIAGGIETAKELGWRYDGSQSEQGIFITEARWKGDPFILTIFFKRYPDGRISNRDKWECNGIVVGDSGDQKLRKLFYHTYDQIMTKKLKEKNP